MERQFKMINLKEEDEKNQEDDQKNQFHYTSPCANEKKIAKPDFSPMATEFPNCMVKEEHGLFLPIDFCNFPS